MKICRASSSMPLVSPIVNVDGVPYLDGGLADSIPINRATKLGNKKVVLILTRNMKYRKKLMTRGEHRLYQSAYEKISETGGKYSKKTDCVQPDDGLGGKFGKERKNFCAASSDQTGISVGKEL